VAFPPGISWQIQLQGKVDTSVKAKVFDIDLLDSSRSLVQKLRNKHRRVICYFSAGTNEGFRSESQQFPPETRGERLPDFPEEQWLDVRQIDKLAPLIERRLDLCKSKGFVAVDFDNVDGYSHKSGFPLTAEDQLAYDRYLAGAAHARGLAAGLKNDVEQVPELAPSFDFAINEQCFQYNECGVLNRNFIRKDKAVLHIEYELKPRQFCARARKLGFSSLYKRITLRAYRRAC
jgi:hypothetical protein